MKGLVRVLVGRQYRDHGSAYCIQLDKYFRTKLAVQPLDCTKQRNVIQSTKMLPQRARYGCEMEIQKSARFSELDFRVSVVPR